MLAVCYYNGAQIYEQFLQFGRLDQALILLGLALYLVSSIFMVLYVLLQLLLYLLVSWAWWDWPLTWLTNHHPSVLWHCWLGHLTCKIVPKVTSNVGNFLSKFRHTRPLGTLIINLLRTWRTDRRTDRQKQHLLPPFLRGRDIIKCKNLVVILRKGSFKGTVFSFFCCWYHH